MTAPAPRPALDARHAIAVVAGAAIGNVLEWFDFTVYAYLATVIGRNFFPSAGGARAETLAFLVFGAGFVARPLGGLLIGLFGDRHGRRPTLLLTFGLISVSTGLIAVLPTWRTIGVAAPVLLLVARLLQGLSAGGEWGSAAAFLVEWAPAHRRGFFGSLHPAAVVAGQLGGSATVATLFALLGPAAMASWGWRIPFALGAGIGPLGLLIRRRLVETPSFRRAVAEAAIRAGDAVRAPAAPPIAGAALRAFGFPALQSVLTYLFLSYYPAFTHRYAGIGATAALFSTAGSTVLMAASCVGAGALSDRIGRRPCLLAACAGAIVLTFPLLVFLLDSRTVVAAIVVQAGFALLCGLFLGAMPATLVELFPTARRLSGLATAYNLQSMLFGGFAPAIASALIVRTGAPDAIGAMVIAAACLSGAVVLGIRETAHAPLR